jgi:hypothetical protein
LRRAKRGRFAYFALKLTLMWAMHHAKFPVQATEPQAVAIAG